MTIDPRVRQHGKHIFDPAGSGLGVVNDNYDGPRRTYIPNRDDVLNNVSSTVLTRRECIAKLRSLCPGQTTSTYLSDYPAAVQRRVAAFERLASRRAALTALLGAEAGALERELRASPFGTSPFGASPFGEGRRGARRGAQKASEFGISPGSAEWLARGNRPDTPIAQNHFLGLDGAALHHAGSVERGNAFDPIYSDAYSTRHARESASILSVGDGSRLAASTSSSVIGRGVALSAAGPSRLGISKFAASVPAAGARRPGRWRDEERRGRAPGACSPRGGEPRDGPAPAPGDGGGAPQAAGRRPRGRVRGKRRATYDGATYDGATGGAAAGVASERRTSTRLW
jgi:hypothetical protein